MLPARCVALDAEQDGFGDVGGQVARVLEVLGDEQEMRARGDVARVVHLEDEVRQQVAERLGVTGIELGVDAPDRACLRGVGGGKGIHHVSRHPLRQSSQVRDPRRPLHRLRLVDLDGAVPDVLDVVAEAFEIGGDAHRCNHESQVARHRLAPRQQPDRVRPDLALHRVDASVGFGDLPRQVGVAVRERSNGAFDPAVHQRSHLLDHGRQVRELVRERLDDVPGRHERGSLSPRDRNVRGSG